MIHSPVNSVHLVSGIKYPPAVAKTYTAQLAAEQKYAAALLEYHTAEAALVVAEADDATALHQAAAAGTGAPTLTAADTARREVAYTDERAMQLQASYIEAAAATRHVLAAHVTELTPLVLEHAREALDAFEAMRANVTKIVAEANATVQAAAHALTTLGAHLPSVTYRVNCIPAEVSIPTADRLGNLTQIVRQVEAMSKGNTEPQFKSEKDESLGYVSL